MSKLPARRIDRSRETYAKKFDQAGSKFGSTVFENNRSLSRIKAREGMKNIIMKNLNFMDEIVRWWRSRWNMPSIIKSRVSSKGLSGDFSFRE